MSTIVKKNVCLKKLGVILDKKYYLKKLYIILKNEINFENKI
jgi:hypothetical protein